MYTKGQIIKKQVSLTTINNYKIYRYGYFSQIMHRQLRRWLQYKDRYITSEYLFCTTKGNIVQVRSFERKLNDYGKRIGLKVNPHQLRNNFAKRFLMEG